jgi:ribosomal-protein-alanine N-acetyltransferase
MRITKRLILRPLELRDYENWHQAYSMLGPARNEWDESAWKETELVKAKFKKILAQQQKLRKQDRFYGFGVFLKDDGVLIGFVDLMDVSRMRFQNAFLGYRIFNNYWGAGYASEACRAVLDIAFKDLKLHRVEAGIAPGNKASIRVAKAIGLRKEGLSLRRLLNHGKWIDLLLYAGTCEDFGRRYKLK